MRWGWMDEDWDAAVEDEVLRSTAEQGLTIEVADEATLNRVARLLAEEAGGAAGHMLVAGGASGGA